MQERGERAMVELELGDEVVAGGVSMGGDIAVALAGIDDRVSRVATVVSTPDWTRPGMMRLDDPSQKIDQGHGDRYSRWLRSHLDPMLHMDSYVRGVEIAFECADLDTHVPPEAADRFKERLTELDAAGRRARARHQASGSRSCRRRAQPRADGGLPGLPGRVDRHNSANSVNLSSQSGYRAH